MSSHADVTAMGTVPPQLRFRESIPLTCDDDVSVGDSPEGSYLVVELPGHDGPCWVCAPVTERAIDSVRCGHCSPWTVLHHSATGTVDIYRTAADGSLHVSVWLCSRLPGVQPERVAA